MQLWAGFECTLNRVNNRFRDQLDPQYRIARKQCLEQLGDLGVRVFRYRIAWDDRRTPQYWIQEDMAQLERQGVAPIIGLLHHGSGPAHVDLLSSDFASGLAEHARIVAERYPATRYWTPINEPLTTARFSALYGVWYPHTCDERAFWLALLNQIDATRLAMKAIRRNNPAAMLVQTDDLGRTFATAALADQAAFDNQRRWMGWDLLCGHVVPGHPFHDRLEKQGFGDRLKIIADDPCPPDIIGVDHYLTSDRFLDHRLCHYPKDRHGGNGHQSYADVEAVRVLTHPYDGLKMALREAWERYGIPVALTECHNGCTREEQMRWLRDGWQAAKELIAEGADIKAVTAWALMGARDWSSLAVENSGDFECGAFDPRSGQARTTGVAKTMA
ncbi:MAG: family 1 glycosylhydrolase, partial [Sphingorhabdus sp.]